MWVGGAAQEWETEMLLRADRQSQNNIYLYSPSMSEADRALTGVTMTPSLTEAVAASVARHTGAFAYNP